MLIKQQLCVARSTPMPRIVSSWTLSTLHSGLSLRHVELLETKLHDTLGSVCHLSVVWAGTVTMPPGRSAKTWQFRGGRTWQLSLWPGENRDQQARVGLCAMLASRRLLRLLWVDTLIFCDLAGVEIHGNGPVAARVAVL